LATAPGRFEGTLRAAILRLKYGRRRALGRELGSYLSEHLASGPFVGVQPSVVVPVPLHASRLRERGFNQSELIAREVAAALGAPLAADALLRTRRTRPQVELRATERAANIHGAFDVRSPGLVEGAAVLLVDDVLTSLSTANECARVLKNAGARAVLVAGVARD
jgi:ComF family protein